MAMLKELGIQEYDPRVICQLLEFAYRYVTTVLEDARVYANHAKKKSVEAEDVRLAVASYLERGFTAPPPREVLLDLTRCKNLAPLPLVKAHCGLRLPPDRYCLSACNYRLARPQIRKLPPKTVINNAIKQAPKPIQTQQNVMVKKPGTLMTVPKTQTVNVPKPVFKFSSGGKTVNKSNAKLDQNSIKMEIDDDSSSVKRKREDDDYDVL